ncbi:MAG TPA: hypothetical protein VMV43_00710 [Candidatus Nanopelagicaceae bacterium]|nr:hypothetical protein [Candidatus Nanopelagicaceae bacterium]
MKITTKISKVLEIDNCNDNDLFKALYVPEFWEEINPTKKMEAKFTAPNVLHTKIYDEVDVIKIPIEMEGELVLSDKGQDPGKGHLIEFNVRNNKDVRELEGRIRIKPLSPNKSKVGVFVESFTLSSDFSSIIGSVSDFVLQNKISEMLRNIEKYCKTKDLKDFLQ